MKAYVLKHVDSHGDVYFKFYNAYTREIKWTGLRERACFWLSSDVAEEQALDFHLKHSSEWKVVEIEL